MFTTKMTLYWLNVCDAIGVPHSSDDNIHSVSDTNVTFRLHMITLPANIGLSNMKHTGFSSPPLPISANYLYRKSRTLLTHLTFVRRSVRLSLQFTFYCIVNYTLFSIKRDSPQCGVHSHIDKMFAIYRPLSIGIYCGFSTLRLFVNVCTAPLHRIFMNTQ